MSSNEDWAVLAGAMEDNIFHGGCDMVDNPDLIFFYVTQFMQECVYYSKTLDAYAIAEVEDGKLLLHNVFSKKSVTLDEVISAFGGEINEATLGFAPADGAGFEKRNFTRMIAPSSSRELSSMHSKRKICAFPVCPTHKKTAGTQVPAVLVY